MLAFVTSLRHPKNSTDYNRVETLLADTLSSIVAQTSEDFVVIVVGNRAPAFTLPERVHFVQVDFPAPVTTSGPRTPRAPFVWDKGTKIGIGIVAARQFAPDFVMIFDADDFVHRDLVAFVSRAGALDVGGWVIRRGLMFSRSRGLYRRQSDFNRTCGTCHIVAARVYETPSSLSVRSTQGEVAAAYGERLDAILGAHREALTWFRNNGVALATLPFRGAVYQVDTNENHSGKGMVGLAWPVTARLARIYGVPIEAPLAARVADGLGPSALLTTVKQFLGRCAEAATRVRAHLGRQPG